MRGGNDFEGYIVVTQNGSFQTATQQDCRDVQRMYNLRMPVLFDVNGDYANTMNALQHWHLVLSSENVISWRAQNRTGDQNFEAEVSALLP